MELNTGPVVKPKKSNKFTKTTAQISNLQSSNPSLTFGITSGKKASVGRVIKRKLLKKKVGSKLQLNVTASSVVQPSIKIKDVQKQTSVKKKVVINKTSRVANKQVAKVSASKPNFKQNGSENKGFSKNLNTNQVAGVAKSQPSNQTNKKAINKGKNKQVNEKTEQVVASRPNFTQNSPKKKQFNRKSNAEQEPKDQFHDSSQQNIKRKHKKDKQSGQVSVVDSNVKKNVLFNDYRKDCYVSSQAGKSVSEKVFTESGKFSDLAIHKYLVSNLEKINFMTLTTVQENGIPVILSGKDVLIRSQTGSGKTLTYAVPIIDALQGITPRLQRKDGVQAIVVVPTRELALQTHELFSKINTFQWIVSGHLCGGENRKSEKDRLRKGVHVLIGTPGRLLDHVLHTSALKIDNVRCLVLDEADRLLDMGFRKDIISLVEALNNAKTNAQYDPLEMLKSKSTKITFNEEEKEVDDVEEFSLRNMTAKNCQTILLSATLTEAVSELADFAMKNHVFVDALDKNRVESGSIVDSLIIPDTVKQEFVVTFVKHRLFTLSALLIEKSKQNSKVFVFMASTQMVNFHYDLFTQCLVKMPVNRGKSKTGNVVLFDVDLKDSDEEDEEEEVVLTTPFFKLHGSMDQKERKNVFNSFRAAQTGILLCTDVVARGIDVPSADCIIQYTGPQTDEDYLHRVGRTGRAGQSGSAIIFLTHEEQEYVSSLSDHGVYLKQLNAETFLDSMCEIMQEPDHERAAEALQRRYETAITKDKELHKAGCFAYSTWSRFYNTYPAKMRTNFNFKNVNLGHYATSFALRDTPSQISRTVRGEVGSSEDTRLNKKLANHLDPEAPVLYKKQRKEKRSVSLINSEYSSGLEPSKKKKKNNINE